MSFLTKTYNKAFGFTAISDDELYYINGGYDTNPSSTTKTNSSYDFGIVIAELELGVAEASLSQSIKDGTLTITIEVGVGTRLYTSFTLDDGTSIEEATQIMKDKVDQAIKSFYDKNHTEDHSEDQKQNPGSGYTGKYGDCGL